MLQDSKQQNVADFKFKARPMPKVQGPVGIHERPPVKVTLPVAPHFASDDRIRERNVKRAQSATVINSSPFAKLKNQLILLIATWLNTTVSCTLWFMLICLCSNRLLDMFPVNQNPVAFQPLLEELIMAILQNRKRCVPLPSNRSALISVTKKCFAERKKRLRR